MPRTFLNRADLRRNSSMPKVNFQLFGQWEKTMDVLKTIGPKVKNASVKAQFKVGNVIVKKVKAHIRNQDLGWEPLNPLYEFRKEKAGMSANTLMAYKTYYNNILVWQSGNGHHLVNIGVKRGIYTTEISGKRSKKDVASIAAMHEFSSGNKLPRRPLWNPTIQEIGGAKGIKKMYVNSLIWHLRMAGIPARKLRGNVIGAEISGSNIKL